MTVVQAQVGIAPSPYLVSVSGDGTRFFTTFKGKYQNPDSRNIHANAPMSSDHPLLLSPRGILLRPVRAPSNGVIKFHQEHALA